MATRRFFLKLGVFLALPVAAAAYFEVRSAEVRNNYTRKNDFAEENKERIEILALGSSHALLGINPELFPQFGYNLALDSQSLSMDVDLAAKFVPRMPNLRLLLFEASYFSLEYSLYDYNRDIAAKYPCFMGVRGDTPLWGLLHPQNYLRTVLYGPAALKDFYNRDFIVDNGYGTNDLGWFSKPSGGPELISASSGHASVVHHHRLMHPENMPAIVGKVDKFLETVDKQRIRVAFISTPLWHTYRDSMDRTRWERDLGALMSVLDRNGISYYDFMAHPDFTIADFADNDHLSHLGAEKFTKILDDSVIKKELKRS